jgi:hypothetical protein
MNALCPGLEQVFRSEWLPALLRKEEGAHLLEWASAASTWLGCTREGAEAGQEGAEAQAADGDVAEQGETPTDEAAGSKAAAAGHPEEAAGTEKEPPVQSAGEAALRPLWMLVGKNGVWFLEPLTIEDHATYCFAGGDEMPALVSRLLCAPQFSKEALYSPLNELVGDKADLAIPARSLGFLVELRSRFKQRVIHQSVDSWKKSVDKLGGSAG